MPPGCAVARGGRTPRGPRRYGVLPARGWGRRTWRRGLRQRGRCQGTRGAGAVAWGQRGASIGMSKDARPPSGSAEKEDNSMQIVMAEHDPRQRAQLRQRLEGVGQYQVHEVEDCMLALKLARQQPPDLILM